MSSTDQPIDDVASGSAAHAPDEEHRNTIVLIVSAPNDLDAKHIPYKLVVLVGDAARVAADKFGYAADGNPSFRIGTTVLGRTITLEAAGLKHLQEVDLVDAGGGV